MKFSQRHIGISSNDEKYMLEYLGAKNINELINKTIPENIRINKALDLEKEMSESQFLEHIFKQSQKNQSCAKYPHTKRGNPKYFIFI